MQPTGFLCSLPDYRPTMAAVEVYARINDITQYTHMGANVLSASAVVLLIAGRSSGTIYDYINTAVTTLKTPI